MERQNVHDGGQSWATFSPSMVIYCVLVTIRSVLSDLPAAPSFYQQKNQDVIKITSEACNKQFCSAPKHTSVSNLQKLCEIDTMLEDGRGPPEAVFLDHGQLYLALLLSLKMNFKNSYR